MSRRLRDPKDPLKALLAAGGPALVVGLGRSGKAAANLLAAEGCRVTVSESARRGTVRNARGGLSGSIRIRWGGHPPALFLRHPLVVVSPGVPTETEALQAAMRNGARVLGEMELAFRLSRLPWVGITGSNGKSTTTTLVGLFTEKAGLPALVGGNLGTPACELIRGEKGKAFLVAEVSSFQLETIETFRPRIATMLNISPDHLDRYREERDYVNAKAMVFSNMEGDDWAVVNHDDPPALAVGRRARCRRFDFSRRTLLERGAMLRGDWLVVRDGDRERKVLLRDRLVIPGSHNLENALAAVAVGHLMGIPPEPMAEVLSTFPGLEHRMELVTWVRGVPIYNDSKGTNVGATVKSLEGTKGSVILIAGGHDKGAPYEPMRPLVKEKVKLLVLLGEAAERMERELGDAAPTVRVATLEDGVRRAVEDARPGDEVLFSPACSSFDMFKNYEQRGRIFKALARKYADLAK